MTRPDDIMRGDINSGDINSGDAATPTTEPVSGTSPQRSSIGVRLPGQVIVVTGASGRAGRAIVSRLHLAGAELVLVARDLAKLEASVADLEPRPELVTADLRDLEATRELFDQVAANHGRVDGVVHLVGGWTAGGVETFDREAAVQLWESLTMTVANTATAAREHLQRSGGRYVTVSSRAVEHTTAQNAIYAAAKSGADRWVAALADSFGVSDASAFSLVVDALYTPQMVARNPNRDLTGWTSVDQLADAVIRNWNAPYTNGTRILP